MEKIGKYKILGTLGKGGMGIVYRGLDPDIERDVAIKTIRFDNFSDGTAKDDLMGRFIREARAAGKMTHSNIVTVYDVCREDDLTYIVMQFIEGQSLQAAMDAGTSFTPQQCAQLMKPICDALDYAHGCGIVHRDIKPANILIDKNGKPYIADFGVARMEESTMTRSGTTVGTLSFMSPEQIKGQEIDGRSDLFSLGVILYELLTGKMPFDGDNISTIVYKIVNEQPRRMAEINKNLPPGYDAVIHKALAKNPEDRFQTCQALASSLENAEQMLEQTMALETEEETKTGGPGRKKALLGAAAVAGIAVLAGGIVLLTSKTGKSAGPETKTAALGAAGQAAKQGPEASSRAAEDNPAPKPAAPGPAEADLVRLKESFEAKRYQETAEIARAILAGYPSNPVALDYAGRVRREQLAAQVNPILQAGIASFQRDDYAQCVTEMEKVLAIDKGNAEAQRYLFQADTTLSKRDILALIERHRRAEESKDLLVVLSDLDSPTLSGQWRGDYTLLFNGYDGISSSVSGIAVTFSSRTEATAKFSNLMTAVYKKDGKKKFFEASKTWRLHKKGNVWMLTGAD
jgi:predicted Ser/Thr protein kinase